MSSSIKTIELKVERKIPASLIEVFDGWLNPNIPGTPWNAAEKYLLDPKVDGLFYWLLKGMAHYGRFTDIERPRRIQYTWMSLNTLGHESLVTVTFRKDGDEALMTLLHSGLPDHERARGHESGWNYFLETFCEQFGNGSRKKFNWEEAHCRSSESMEET